MPRKTPRETFNAAGVPLPGSRIDLSKLPPLPEGAELKDVPLTPDGYHAILDVDTDAEDEPWFEVDEDGVITLKESDVDAGRARLAKRLQESPSGEASVRRRRPKKDR